MIANPFVRSFSDTFWAPINVGKRRHVDVYDQPDHHNPFVVRQFLATLVLYLLYLTVPTMNMQEMYPSLFENGQYLEEWDPERGDRYSEAATKAQETVSEFSV